jgi:hypothetical protein
MDYSGFFELVEIIDCVVECRVYACGEEEETQIELAKVRML